MLILAWGGMLLALAELGERHAVLARDADQGLAGRDDVHACRLVARRGDAAGAGACGAAGR